MTRKRRDGAIVVWDGSKRLRGGLLNCSPEVPQPCPSGADDPRELVGARRPGRPARAGVRATARIELRLTLEELHSLKALAASNSTTLADLIRTTMLDIAGDGGATEGVVQGRDLLNCCR